MKIFVGFKALKSHPVIVIGDFNKILVQKENVRGKKLMENSREALEVYNLADISHKGDYFT